MRRRQRPIQLAEPEGALRLRPAHRFWWFRSTTLSPKSRRTAIVRAAVGGWTLSGTLQYQNGGLIATPGSQNNLSTLLFRSTLFNRVPGVAALH